MMGYSDSTDRTIPRACAQCGAVTNKWFPWPGLWLCPTCFMTLDSTSLSELAKRLEVSLDGKS
jgi:RNA polymerase subunit RPABC4/transcription elongation factor Spt4